MSLISPAIPRALILALLMGEVFADTIILKSGERIEGRVVSETATELKLEVKVSASITDDRTVAKADVEKIEKVSPEAEAYKVISTILPGANSFAASQYDQSIRVLQAFLKQYPTSTNAAEVQKTLTQFEEEKKRVESGEVKLEGRWLSKEEVDKEKVQIGGRMALNYMKSQAAAGDFIGALTTFAALEKPYGGAASFPDSVVLARQIIARFKPTVDAAVANQKALKAEREKGFATAGPADRKEMMDAYKRDLDAAEAAVTAAEKANQWPPLIPISEKSVVSLQKRLQKEGDRLGKLPTDKMEKSLQLVAEAGQKLGNSDIEGAVAALKEATTLWPANEMAVRMAKETTATKAAAPKSAPAATPPSKSAPSQTAPKPSASVHAGSDAGAQASANEETKPFFMTLPGAITVIVGVAVVLGGVNVFLKLKKQKDNQP